MHIQAKWKESTHLAFALKGSLLKCVYFKGSTTKWDIFIYLFILHKCIRWIEAGLKWDSSWSFALFYSVMPNYLAPETP